MIIIILYKYMAWPCRRCVGGVGPRPPATESRVTRAPSAHGVTPGVPTWGAQQSPFHVRSAHFVSHGACGDSVLAKSNYGSETTMWG